MPTRGDPVTLPDRRRPCVKATANDGIDETIDDAHGRKRRFRFTRKQMDDDLDYLDAIATQVDELQLQATSPGTAAQAPAPDTLHLAEVAQERARIRAAAIEAAAHVASLAEPATPVAPQPPPPVQSIPAT